MVPKVIKKKYLAIATSYSGLSVFSEPQQQWTCSIQQSSIMYSKTITELFAQNANDMPHTESKLRIFHDSTRWKNCSMSKESWLVTNFFRHSSNQLTWAQVMKKLTFEHIMVRSHWNHLNIMLLCLNPSFFTKPTRHQAWLPNRLKFLSNTHYQKYYQNSYRFVLSLTEFRWQILAHENICIFITDAELKRTPIKKLPSPLPKKVPIRKYATILWFRVFHVGLVTRLLRLLRVEFACFATIQHDDTH